MKFDTAPTEPQPFDKYYDLFESEMGIEVVEIRKEGDLITYTGTSNLYGPSNTFYFPLEQE